MSGSSERVAVFGEPWPQLNEGLLYNDVVSPTDSSNSLNSPFLIWFFPRLKLSLLTICFDNYRIDTDRILLHQAQKFSSFARVTSFF